MAPSEILADDPQPLSDLANSQQRAAWFERQPAHEERRMTELEKIVGETSASHDKVVERLAEIEEMHKELEILAHDTEQMVGKVISIAAHSAQTESDLINHPSTTSKTMAKVASTALGPSHEGKTSYELQLDDTVYFCKSIIGPKMYKQIEKVHKMTEAGVTDIKRYARIDAKIRDLTEDQMAMMAGKSVIRTRLRRRLRAMLGFKKDNIQYSLGYSKILDDTRIDDLDGEVCAAAQQEEQQERKESEVAGKDLLQIREGTEDADELVRG